MCHSHYAERGAYGRHAFQSMRGRHGRFHHHGRWNAGWQQAPVNVQEHLDRYELQLIAPGLNKDAFSITLQGDVLTIVHQSPENDHTSANWTRREYRPGSFERQFVLNEKIDRENIIARYEDGVLILALYKLRGQESFSQNIPVE